MAGARLTGYASNMGTHRKILVADGRVGFTGGMNIRAGNCLQRQSAHPVRDLHFRVEGPVVTQLQEAFADDWLFTTGEALRGDAWFPQVGSAGQVLARGVTDDPDEKFERLLWTLLGALSIARSLPARLRDGFAHLLTPYL
jgi:cardiolipin synthase